MRLELPTSWEGVSVGKFQELYPVLSSESNLVERVPAFIAVLSGQPLDKVMKIQLSEYQKIAKALSFLDTIDELKEVKTSFVVEGKRYEIQPEISKMCGAQYMDFMHFLGECKGDQNLVIQNLDNLLSCVVLRSKRKWFKWRAEEYNGSEIIEMRRRIRESMPISLAYPIAVFFWNHWQKSIRNMAAYGNQQLMKVEEVIKEVQTDLQKHGAGTSH